MASAARSAFLRGADAHAPAAPAMATARTTQALRMRIWTPAGGQSSSVSSGLQAPCFFSLHPRERSRRAPVNLGHDRRRVGVVELDPRPPAGIEDGRQPAGADPRMPTQVRLPHDRDLVVPVVLRARAGHTPVYSPP